MRKAWELLKYYYCWKPIIFWLAVLGALMFLLKIIASFLSDSVTIFLGMFSFGLMLLIPYCSGATALRMLISSNQSNLIPGFRLHAGVAYLALTVIATVYLYLSTLIFSDIPITWLFILRTFICLSAFAGLMQFVLPSKFFVALISTAPLAVVMIITQYKELVAALFLDQSVTLALFVLSLFGWGYALRLLKVQNHFKPVNDCVNNSESWATYDGGFLTRQAIGQPRSAAGTLLLGYPDSWSGIIFRVFYYYLVTPVLTTGAVFIIGFGEKWDKSVMDTIGGMYLMFSMFSAVYCIFIYGELVARARLVWLRYSTDRKSQWRLVESFCLRFLFVYYLFAVCITIAALILTDLPEKHIGHYLIIVVSYCFFNLYLALLLRANNQHWIVMALTVIITVVALVFGIMLATAATIPDPRFLMVIESLFLVLGFAFRAGAHKTFMEIDWKLVSITTGRRRLALGGE